MYDCHDVNNVDCIIIACPLAVNLVNLEWIKNWIELNINDIQTSDSNGFVESDTKASEGLSKQCFKG